MSIFLLTSAIALSVVAKLLFVVPSKLSHLPRAPLLPLLFSYLSLEAEDQRIQRIVLPFANEKREPLVLVWTFGMWIVHIIDFEVGQAAMKDKVWVRQLPPQDLLLWKFVGRSNLAFTIGDEWRKHSRAITSIFSRPLPIQDFVAVAQRLLIAIERDANKTVAWDQLAKRVTIDILGTTVLGSDTQAIDFPESSIITTYNRCMTGLTAPPYIFLPFLDKYFPRRSLVNDTEYLRGLFSNLIKEKKTNPGNDLISLMLAEPSFSEQDVLDNVSVFFVAGHETTTGALSSIVYYFAIHPEHQQTARAEVCRVLGSKERLNMDLITQMPFVFACIQEAMRLNNPSNFTLPRSNSVATTLRDYYIPPDTLMCFNISGVHHLEKTWKSHDQYIPERFMSSNGNGGRTAFFGAGLRQCPARHFAMWEIRTIVIMLLKVYKWSLPPGSIHKDRIQNSFSFSTNLNLPKDLFIWFEKL
ncbi:Cytochrome P450 4F12 [Leucoagaricus sp. SymC.cos]|nr:Cytochrome P450 4F12 [Leucoagaricus sp. SymC.cos]